MTKLKFPLVSIVCLLCLSLGAENVTWPPVPEATSYRLSYGLVGGATNILNVGTNVQTWLNKVSGTTFTAAGVSNVPFTLNQRHFVYVQTVVSYGSVSVISDPNTVVFYTPRPSPTNVVIIGE